MIGAAPFYLAGKSADHTALVGTGPGERNREYLRRPVPRLPHAQVSRRRRRLRVALG